MRTRNKEVCLWFTEDELKALDDKVERTGLTRASYLRKVLLGHEIKERPPVEFFETLKHLRKISLSMSDIAYAARYKYELNDALYRENAKYLQKVISDLFSQYYG